MHGDETQWGENRNGTPRGYETRVREQRTHSALFPLNAQVDYWKDEK